MRTGFALALSALAVWPSLMGCTATGRLADADTIAASAGLARVRIPAAPFVLTAYLRIGDPAAPVSVYIEGDGLAWLSRTEPSPDPTPRSPVALRLAAADPAANVAYLARPCQYTPMAENPVCAPAYWTGRRFAPEVIAATGRALDAIAARTTRRELHLTGYSGGGAVAVLAAAERGGVASIRTVAGNLDHGAVNRLHRVSPLNGSLNPIDAAPRVARIPQIHFSGDKDTVVPPSIAAGFAAAAPSPCVQTRTITGATHADGWVERWPELLAQTPACTDGLALSRSPAAPSAAPGNGG
ncbi:pimeloyl-ACP methyl ester carboxylesterase [Azospirillum fermentarium]|uniref:alpha/beta hydrolase n=1 Tax=Azospirillum fermentarium TaxID=1233114 RepID=UPI0022266E02|nr:alpha/beta hydrolase [Azospirillum fermentarium]MCW2248246.1 pimeloyl-ACP methyl ester carboxylesterase [Azospirillum fermentarium]